MCELTPTYDQQINAVNQSAIRNRYNSGEFLNEEAVEEITQGVRKIFQETNSSSAIRSKFNLSH